MRRTEDNLGRRRGLGCIGVKEGQQVVTCGIFDKRTAEADERHTHDNGEEGKPSVGWLAGGVEDEVAGEVTELV